MLIIAGNARSLIANRGDLIREIKRLGLGVAAAVPRADYLAEVEELGIEIHPIYMGRTGINPASDLRTLLILYRLMKDLKPAVVFGYNIKPVIYGSLAANLAGVPRIYSMITGLGHIFTAKDFKTRGVRRIVSLLYRAGLSCNSRVFFQNPDDLAEFIDKGILRDRSRAVRTNGSGVNMERFARQPIPEGPVTFLFIARLLIQKGIFEFCEAARQIKDKYPEARFVAVGPHDPGLPQSCSTRDLERWKSEGAVEFIGGVKDVRPWIKQCSVFVLPSYYREGTPRSVLEAMSMGRPIITCDSPGCRETVVEGENGFLVPPRRVEPLAAAMARFLEAPDLVPEMAEASWVITKRYYDVHKVNQVILEAMELT
ncbi:MAG: glycosyltransferase family 4 protein [Desulfosalsimonas sp.]